MIKLKSLINEEKISILSPQEVKDRGLWGPVWHGTSQENWELIDKEGFKVFIGNEIDGNVSHGYEVSDYSNGIPAPIHHLGFGIYFTTKLSIAKKYNHGTSKGLKQYYLDVPKLEVINFAAPNTMMKWWIKNGYDFKKTPETTFGGIRNDWGGTVNTLPNIRNERLRATNNLTDELKSKYDAVWFKGKTLYSVLDGDQVCVYDPKNIYQVDYRLAKPFEIGSFVIAKDDIKRVNYNGEIYKQIEKGTKGLVIKKTLAKDVIDKYPTANTWVKNANWIFEVSWVKGGSWHDVLDFEIDPYKKYD